MGGIITLTTDFGTRDGYAAVLKGAVLSADSGVEVVDITHDIAPFHAGQAAFAIFNVYSRFPAGTIHIIVVDPGVGSRRGILLMEAGERYCIAPDNGVLDPIAFLHDDHRCFRIDTSLFSGVSSTFHGRDIFVPAALRLLKGEKPADLGEPKEYEYRILTEEMRDGRQAVSLHADHFGNIITSLVRSRADEDTLRGLRFSHLEIPFVDHYSQAEAGNPVCLFGSTGLLEIAIKEESAMAYFRKRWNGMPAKFEIIRK